MFESDGIYSFEPDMPEVETYEPDLSPSQVLRDLLDKLPESQREVMDGELAGLSLREIARRFGVSLAAIQRRRKRAGIRLARLARPDSDETTSSGLDPRTPMTWSPRSLTVGADWVPLECRVGFLLEVLPQPYGYEMDLGGDVPLSVPAGHRFATDHPLEGRHTVRFRSDQLRELTVIVKTWSA